MLEKNGYKPEMIAEARQIFQELVDLSQKSIEEVKDEEEKMKEEVVKDVEEEEVVKDVEEEEVVKEEEVNEVVKEDDNVDEEEKI
jgi:hypothetical protein